LHRWIIDQWWKLAADMITYEEARKRILDRIGVMPATQIALPRLLGYVTAAPVVARLDSPPFDNSAVDGYGVRVQDVANATEAKPVRLSLKATVRAGDPPPSGRLAAGSAMKILTGACVAQSVEAVVMREYCREEGGAVFVSAPIEAGENIRRRGGEFLRGTEVMPAGRLLSPSMVGLIANLGYRNFDVYRKPRASVVTTGNELTKPGRDLLPGMIYDSNSYAMESALLESGIEDVLMLHAREDFASTKNMLMRALSFSDIVISTGGVSVGEFDYVKAALESLGVKTELWRIAIKPGKPVYFGILEDKRKRRNKYVFGLPGNPVSALVTYHQFVLPALRKLSGISDYADEIWVPATLTKPIKKRAGRLEFVRGKFVMKEGRLQVEPTTGQDSHMLGGLAAADALIYFDKDEENWPAGKQVNVTPLNWRLR
jgi:molybdopterin molybdotransferase